MKTLNRVAAVGVLCWLGMGAGVAQAKNAFIDDGSESSGNSYGLRLASNVSVNTPITIQTLGVFDAGLDGLSLSHIVNLYDTTDTTIDPILLGTATVPAGLTTLDQGFEYASILPGPVSVAAGKTLSVVVYQLEGNSPETQGQDPYRDATTFNGTPDLTYTGNSYAFDNGTTGIPPGGGAGTGDVFRAASFQYTVPEPASISLLSVAGMGLLARRRKA